VYGAALSTVKLDKIRWDGEGNAFQAGDQEPLDGGSNYRPGSLVIQWNVVLVEKPGLVGQGDSRLVSLQSCMASTQLRVRL
jgi:hypothetical protein